MHRSLADMYSNLSTIYTKKKNYSKINEFNEFKAKILFMVCLNSRNCRYVGNIRILYIPPVHPVVITTNNFVLEKGFALATVKLLKF